MVIGCGLIAQAFKVFENNSNILVFASGVSNSKETNPIEFEREKKLLIKTLNNNSSKKIIYFSTTSVFDKELRNNDYIQHKLKMEELIMNNSLNYYIFRLSEVVGKTKNQNTIVNFLINSISKNIRFDLWKNACRRIISVDDVFRIVCEIIKNDIYMNEIVNITTDKKCTIFELVETIEMILHKKANYNILDKGFCYDISTEKIKNLESFKTIKENKNYVSEIVVDLLKDNKFDKTE